MLRDDNYRTLRRDGYNERDQDYYDKNSLIFNITKCK